MSPTLRSVLASLMACALLVLTGAISSNPASGAGSGPTGNVTGIVCDGSVTFHATGSNFPANTTAFVHTGHSPYINPPFDSFTGTTDSSGNLDTSSTVPQGMWVAGNTYDFAIGAPGGIHSPPGTFTLEACVVDNKPTAALSASPTSGTAPLTVNADGTGSTDDHGVESYDFTWGDGTSTGFQPNAKVSHTYSTADTYHMSLVVKDTAGQASTNSATQTITVNPVVVPPVLVTPESPTATTPSCDTPQRVVTPPNQDGVSWTPAGMTVLNPGQNVTYVASATTGHAIKPGATTRYFFENKLDTKKCGVTEKTIVLVFVMDDPKGNANNITFPQHLKSAKTPTCGHTEQADRVLYGTTAHKAQVNAILASGVLNKGGLNGVLVGHGWFHTQAACVNKPPVKHPHHNPPPNGGTGPVIQSPTGGNGLSFWNNPSELILLAEFLAAFAAFGMLGAFGWHRRAKIVCALKGR